MTVEEIQAAIETLSAEEIIRLKKYLAGGENELLAEKAWVIFCDWADAEYGLGSHGYVYIAGCTTPVIYVEWRDSKQAEGCYEVIDLLDRVRKAPEWIGHPLTALAARRWTRWVSLRGILPDSVVDVGVSHLKSLAAAAIRGAYERSPSYEQSLMVTGLRPSEHEMLEAVCRLSLTPEWRRIRRREGRIKLAEDLLAKGFGVERWDYLSDSERKSIPGHEITGRAAMSRFLHSATAFPRAGRLVEWVNAFFAWRQNVDVEAARQRRSRSRRSPIGPTLREVHLNATVFDFVPSDSLDTLVNPETLPLSQARATWDEHLGAWVSTVTGG